MAGKIVADTLEHSTAGSVTTDYVVNGSAKAWVHFDGSSATSVVNALNIGSITDNATGNFTLNFSSSFDNANYAGAGQAGYNDSDLSNSRIVFQTHDAPTTSAFRIGVTIDNGTEEDSTHITQLFMGDLA